jgi:3-isopropylmalate dehydratase small subunit
MAYDKFNILESSAVPLPIENIDTDQIIPARFLIGRGTAELSSILNLSYAIYKF